MKTYELPFAKLSKLTESIVEVIVNEGVEMNLQMVNQFHDWLVMNMRSEIGLLINKINQYTYDFKSQMELGNLPEIKAIAVISYSTITEQTTRSLGKMPRKYRWNFEIFNNREEALKWIDEQLKP